MEVGDTFLVFAEEFKAQMLGSYICGRHPTFSRLSPEEIIFIDTAAPWGRVLLFPGAGLGNRIGPGQPGN